MPEFIPANYYNFLYLLIVSIITIAVSSKYSKRDGLIEYRYANSKRSELLLVWFMILFIGLRPINGVFVDMKNYDMHFHALFYGEQFQFDWNTDNLLFDNMFHWWGAMKLEIWTFFFAIAIIYFGAAYLGIRRLFPNHSLAAYLVFLGAFSTFSFGTNGIKGGAAASLFIWAISYRQNLKVCIPLVLLSWGFHHSMQLLVTAFILTTLFKKPKYYFGGWLFCLMLAALRVTYFQYLFGGLTDDQGASYLVGGDGSTVATKILGGFRIDFILYSAIPVLVGYYAEIKKKLNISPLYRDLLHLYICVNGLWMLCMYAEFTNRIAYLSWFLYPIVLIYPFLYEDWGANKYRMFSKVMLYHVCFTVFMDMIFYGGFMKLFM